MTYVSNYAIAAILCLQTVCHCVISTLGQYIYSSFLQIYPYPSNTTYNLTTIITPVFYRSKIVNSVSARHRDSTTNNAQLWAEEQSADLFFWTNLSSSCPIIIMTYILGLYTPKLGRRFVLLLPMFGTTIQLSIWLAIIYYHLPEYWWYIAAILVGLSGSDNVRSNVHVFPIDPFYFFVCRFRSQSIHH